MNYEKFDESIFQVTMHWMVENYLMLWKQLHGAFGDFGQKGQNIYRAF